jgi:hypothetical protein
MGQQRAYILVISHNNNLVAYLNVLAYLTMVLMIGASGGPRCGIVNWFQDFKTFYSSSLTARGQCYKTFSAVSYEFCNKLERLPQASFPSLV